MTRELYIEAECQTTFSEEKVCRKCNRELTETEQEIFLFWQPDWEVSDEKVYCNIINFI